MDLLPGMNADAFHPSDRCPLCRNTANSVVGGGNGHAVCPYCQGRFVLSTHGFIRDPFRPASIVSIQKLRRQSRPLARLLRDTQTPLRTILGGIAILTIGALAWSSYARQTPNASNHHPPIVADRL
jgi:hypothetical protein